MDRARAILGSLVLLTVFAVEAVHPSLARAAGACGYLTGPIRGGDGQTRSDRQPYMPRAGDLILYSDHNVFWSVIYALAWTGAPFHSGIVVELPDGQPAALEAGAYDRTDVIVADLLPRLRSHDGTLVVRRLRVPLSPERSRLLTQYAMAQTTKSYAIFRVSLEITPFRAHGPLHSRLFGSPRLDRSHWFCSELTMAAAAVAGLINPKVIRPNSVYPRDILRDQPYDFSAIWEGPASWSEGP